MSTGFVIALLGVCAIGLTAIYSLRFLYDYRIANGAIEVLLFRTLSVYRIPISNIEQIGIPNRRDLWISPLVRPFVLRLGNRFRRNPVLIQRRTGLIRNVVITPDEPDRFIDQVRALLPP